MKFQFFKTNLSLSQLNIEQIFKHSTAPLSLGFSGVLSDSGDTDTAEKTPILFATELVSITGANG